MLRYLSKSIWLLGLVTVLVCGVYPAVLWVIGQTAFPFQANGSIVNGPDGKPVGSLLIAQPFTKDEYFQTRPSAVSYDASASGSSTLSATNYLLRDGVARMLGPIAQYASGPKAGQLVAPALVDSFRKLTPRTQLRNPLMFCVYVGSILTTILWIAALNGQAEASSGFILAIALWLWFTVLFANFAEALAEGRSKAQAESLRSAKHNVVAKKLRSPIRKRLFAS